MSMFLAPIHFMVYGKNQLQEQLIARIAERAAAEGWATAEALDAYQNHPDHVAIKPFIGAIRLERQCMDYTWPAP